MASFAASTLGRIWAAAKPYRGPLFSADLPIPPAAATAATAAEAAAVLGYIRTFATNKDKGKRTSCPSSGPLCSKPPSPFEAQKRKIEKWLAAAAAALVLRHQQLQQLRQQQQPEVERVLQQPQQLLFEHRQQQILNQYKAKLTEMYGEVYVHREWPLLRFAAEQHFMLPSKP